MPLWGATKGANRASRRKAAAASRGKFESRKVLNKINAGSNEGQGSSNVKPRTQHIPTPQKMIQQATVASVNQVAVPSWSAAAVASMGGGYAPGRLR